MNTNNSPVDWAKKAWGVGAPKGFRFASWVVAAGAFGIWYYYDNRVTITDHRQISAGMNKKEA